MAIRAKAFQPAKTKAIAEAKEVLQAYNDYIFADYRGLTVEQISELRKKLRELECEFKVVKNNFARVAFEELEITSVSDLRYCKKEALYADLETLGRGNALKKWSWIFIAGALLLLVFNYHWNFRSRK